MQMWKYKLTNNNKNRRKSEEMQFRIDNNVYADLA